MQTLGQLRNGTIKIMFNWSGYIFTSLLEKDKFNLGGGILESKFHLQFIVVLCFEYHNSL